MNNSSYSNVADIFAAARKIADELTGCGQVDASHEIIEVVSVGWATSSEAIGEARLILLKYRDTVEKHLGVEMVTLLDDVVVAADDLLHGRKQKGSDFL